MSATPFWHLESLWWTLATVRHILIQHVWKRQYHEIIFQNSSSCSQFSVKFPIHHICTVYICNFPLDYAAAKYTNAFSSNIPKSKLQKIHYCIFQRYTSIKTHHSYRRPTVKLCRQYERQRGKLWKTPFTHKGTNSSLKKEIILVWTLLPTAHETNTGKLMKNIITLSFYCGKLNSNKLNSANLVHK